MAIRRPISPLALRGSLSDPFEGVRQSLSRLDTKLAGNTHDEQLSILHEAALSELYFVQSASRFLRDCARGRTQVTEGLVAAVRTRREQATAKLSSIVRRMDILGEHIYLAMVFVSPSERSEHAQPTRSSTLPDFASTRMAELAQQLSDERRRAKSL
ncbi:uncharacterized protein SCHCODRAFT_01171568 [Schizophyllum commune H4-8]|nr:uncharacterized protein SCHCODRAFT_01171568 [Schizophyllum commune H4-8]KAI5892425.1 hypothetical protein SCHCODRAFT_01171568 [Schizophyllum commune H4-8]